MKMNFKNIFLAANIFVCCNSFAQGGDDCTAAQSSPITIPFTGVGNTCNGTNIYNSTNLPLTTCISPFYLDGQDWVYYFTATQTGPLQIMLSNMSPMPWGSISVWQGCPLPSGTCIGGVANWSTTLSVIVNVVNGQNYYIVIDCWPTPNCFSYDINVNYITPPQPQAACTNVDFEMQNFTGWYGTTGTITIGATNAPHPQYNMSGVSLVPPQHNIVTGPGLDPCGNFPVVCPGGTASVQLGDGQMTGSLGAQLIQVFNVSPSNAIFTYKYAVVVEDATHMPYEQPFFHINMFDSLGDTIQCAKYLVVGGPNIPGFFVAACGFGQTYYRPWTTVSVDLTPYIGQNVTVQFTVGDCCYGGHYGYAYVDCTCDPFYINSQSDTICQGQTTTLTAPSGAAQYSWVPGNQTTQTISVNQAGVYTVYLTAVANSSCVSSITDTIYALPGPTAGFSFVTTNCSGNPNIQFTDTSHAPTGGNIVSYYWNFGDNSTSTQQSPSHQYANMGTYNVYLVVTSDIGCTDTFQVQLTLTGPPVANFTVDDTAGCVTHCVQFTDQSTTPLPSTLNQWSWNFGDGNTSTQQNTSHCYTVPGDYTVTLMITNSSGCMDTLIKQAYIHVYPRVVADFSATPNPVSAIDPTVNFTDLSTGSPNTWAWTWGDNTPGSNVQNPQHQFPGDPNGTQYYTVTLIANNQYNCPDTAVQIIQVDPEYTFYAPNCVTPNGDGINDFFFTYGVGWKTYKLMIFDRWGDMIWWTEDMNKGWDCKVMSRGDGKTLVQEDTYIWKVLITDVFDKKHQYIGHVSVVR